MARQDGVIKIQGQMGGISFYKSKDGHLARLKSGISSDRIKNDPAFARTRENGAEFGRAGVSGKLLRTAFRNLTQNARDGRMISRLTQQMMKVVQSDSLNARGERNAANGDVTLLEGFEFNSGSQLDKMFFVPYEATIERAGGILTIDIPEFNPKQQITAPPGATHFRLIAGAAELDFAAGSYSSSTTQSADLVLSPNLQPALQLTHGVTAGSTKSLFLVFGIVFFQDVNTLLYSLRNGAYNALTIAKVDRGS